MADYSDALTAVENALRFLIYTIGLERCAPRPDHIKKWESLRTQDHKQRGAGFGEQRLLSYADLGHLNELILRESNWPLFEAALGSRSEVIVFLELLRRFRNPDAHNRELSSHEQALVIGVSGELRTRIIRYMSSRDTPDSYFARIIEVQNNVGAQAQQTYALRVGDEVEFIVEATDPFGASIEYRFSLERNGVLERADWSPNNRWIWHVDASHVGKNIAVSIQVRSPRSARAYGDHDDAAAQYFTVLPRAINESRAAE